MPSTFEKNIVFRIVRKALVEGFAVAVHDGQEKFGPFTSWEQLVPCLYSVGDETLIFYEGHIRKGSIYLVYGNEEDIASDWSQSLDNFMDDILSTVTR